MADKPDTGVRKRRPGTGKSLRAFKVGSGLPPITTLQSELQDYMDVLLGRVDPPLDAGVMTLQECADMYYARASEMTVLIQAAEREGRVMKGQPYYHFRTGELRTFLELAKRAADLGSRRLTQEQLNFEMATYGRESKGSIGT